MFQSPPLTEARGDVLTVTSTNGVEKFQSPPLTEARGDAAPPREGDQGGPVSIPSPDRSQGRREPMVALTLTLSPFQSPPLTEARGDGISRGLELVDSSFNPLP